MRTASTPLPAESRERLEDIYRQFHSRVLRCCLYMLESPEEAEDAASEIFLRLPAALKTYDQAQPFAPWLLRVTRNYCVDLIRRRQLERRIIQPAQPEALEAEAPDRSPIEQMLREEESAAVLEALKKLPDRYRRPIVERYWSGQGYGEIARNLGLTRANVATLIFRAKEGLRHALALQGAAARSEQWA